MDEYAASGAWDMFGEVTRAEPHFPEEQRTGEPTVDLGLIGGEIADAVAAGRRSGKPVLVIGGNCASVPGVLGGLQQAHGPNARIGGHMDNLNAGPHRQSTSTPARSNF